jgi:hypothetical protein
MLDRCRAVGVDIRCGDGTVLRPVTPLYAVRLLKVCPVATAVGKSTVEAGLVGVPRNAGNPAGGVLSVFIWPWLRPLTKLSTLALPGGGFAKSPFVLGASADVPCLRSLEGATPPSAQKSAVASAAFLASVMAHFFSALESVHSRGVVHGDMKAANMGMLEEIWRRWHIVTQRKVFRGVLQNGASAAAAATAAAAAGRKAPRAVIVLRVDSDSKQSLPAFVTEQPFRLYDWSFAKKRGSFADEHYKPLSCTAGYYPHHWFRGYAQFSLGQTVSPIYLPLPPVSTTAWAWRAAVQDEWFAMEQTWFAMLTDGHLHVGADEFKATGTKERTGMIQAGRLFIRAVERLPEVGDSMTFLEHILAHKPAQCMNQEYHDGQCLPVRELHRALTSNDATKEVWDVLNSVSLAMKRVKLDRDTLQVVARVWREPTAMVKAIARLRAFVKKQYDEGVLP